MERARIFKSNEKEQFSKRLNQAAADSHLTYYGMYSDLARMFEMSAAGVKKWFDAEAMPPPNKIDKLAQYYQVRAEWLRANRGPMREITGLDANSQGETIFVARIPVLTATDLDDFLNGQYKGDENRVIVTGSLPSKAYAIRIEDNSLGEFATRGMHVVVDAQKKPGPEDLGVVVVAGVFISGHVVKRDQYILVPPNTAFPPVVLGDSPKIVGTVIAVAQRSFNASGGEL